MKDTPSVMRCSAYDHAGQNPVDDDIETERVRHRATSVPGQEQTHAPQQTASLFDHLVRGGEQRGWNFKTERLRGLHVGGERELRRLLERQVRGPRAFENAINQGRHARKALALIRTVGHQAAQMQIEENLVNLSPGMAATVEIKTGSRRIISYLLSPFVKYGHESLRER